MNIEEWVRPSGVYTRTQRAGLELLAKAEIKPAEGGVWKLYPPGETKPLILNFAENRKYCHTPGICSCDAFQKSRPPVACEHLWAMLYNIQPPSVEETSPPLLPHANPIIEANSVPNGLLQPPVGLLEAASRGGYSRFSTSYSKALGDATWSILLFGDKLFADITQSLEWHPQQSRGRRRIPTHRILYGLLARALLETSFRGAAGWMRVCADHGVRNFEGKSPGFDTLAKANRDEMMTEIATALIAMTAEPIKAFGKVRIGADGTGFGTNAKSDWMNEGKYRQPGTRPTKWYRANIMWDLDSLAILAATVTDIRGKDTGEQTEAFKLIDAVRVAGWDVEWAAFDAGYHSAAIRDAVYEHLKADPIIPFHRDSKNAIPKSREVRERIKHPEMLERMFHMYKANDGSFREKYRYRVKAESGNHNLKKMLGDSVSTFGDRAKINEILWKCVAHNLRMLHYTSAHYHIDLGELLKR